ncbi:54S ribosomal protein L19 [Taphrina deformans PYCC 5710]|uniref:Large ribosomal subunit protein uL11m n=1 Tax=Taphrina deformans (strain PYCC 5710 / ATCC 11124 / CBS 356.35 / IMI 108563 / JCM 9778 / NBRC 8474) TaxID=1097556 RepID=R4X7A3_TAPDE|nr:54S ribosomal protein L19 [Taphrina deformans PYCC 5710]|eukprot:CCG81207.1 54S ribosomal protein L19 [Taphrina deformans PYCC 5710]
MSRAVATKDVLVKLIVPAGGATPSPPIGPALGARGVKSIDFCKEFNARTSAYAPGVPLPVLITIRPNRTFAFDIKMPSTAWLLMKAAGISKGTGEPGKSVAGKISLKHVFEVAQIKARDEKLKSLPLESICKSVVGTAKTMGIQVVP